MKPIKLFSHISKDFPASIVVFLVALPLCLGISLASGAPMISGVIGGIVGGIVIGSLSGSQLSVSGPAAGLSAIVLTSIGQLPTFNAFLLAVVLAGVFQVVLGYLKAGIIGDYIPSSVIKGMLAAIGIIIILKQLPHAVGYNIDFEGDESFSQIDGENTLTALQSALYKLTPLALCVTILGLLIQIVWPKIINKQTWLGFIPAPLIVVLVSILLNIGVNDVVEISDKGLVSIPIANDVSGFFTFFSLPDFFQITNSKVWSIAITLALVASIETLLSLEAVDKIDPDKNFSPTNRELKAQGVGNIVSGLIGGLPLTSVIVRSSANVTAGGKTKLTTILHGLFLLISIVTIPSLLNKIPLSALASILLFTGYKLTNPKLFISSYKLGKSQFLPFITTIIAIVLTDLLKGVAIGICVAVVFILINNYRKAFTLVNIDNNYLLKFRKDVTFLNKAHLKAQLESINEDYNLIIDLSDADFIDIDVLEIIKEYKEHCETVNIKLEIIQGKNQNYFI